ncbi:putative RNA-directed DNA polymerase, partial [Gregarina niphandrodes]
MKAQLTLENGSELLTTFAVVDDVPSTLLILGLPFLIASAATCNFKRLSFVNRDGFARLYQQPASTDLPLNYSISLPDDPSITEALQHVTDLTARGAVAELLYKYSTLWKDRKRGVVSTIKHEILLTTTRPIVSRPRVRTPEQDKTIDSEIQKMLTDDVIRPSLSPYASEIVMVLKKTGDWRMCIDFRPLNRATIDDKYPLPKLSEMIRSIKDSRYFIALDLRSGYWQIPMSESSIEYTAFRTATGLYEFKVMPFGLKNAPATFQRSMNFLLDDLRYSGVLVYLDDILIHSPDIPTLLKLTDK